MYKWYQVLVQDLDENINPPPPPPPPSSGLSPFLAKKFRTPQFDSIFGKGVPTMYNVWFWRYGAKQAYFFDNLWPFLPFYSHNNPENQNFEKKKKKCSVISSFYNRAPQMTITWCIVSKIMSTTHWILPLFYLSSLFFTCHFTSNNSENPNFEKRKTIPGDIITLHKCTKNHDHMLCCSWDISQLHIQRIRLLKFFSCTGHVQGTWNASNLKYYHKIIQFNSSELSL